MHNPRDVKYSKEHEWVRADGGLAVCGITDFAQSKLTDIVFIELPKNEVKASRDSQVAVIESVKSVSDIFCPVSGTIVEVNEALKDSPEIINSDPYGKGWIFKVRMEDPSEMDSLMSADEYEDLTRD